MRTRSVLMTADAVGGVWRYAIDLGTALAMRNVRTTLAVMGPPPSELQRREADRAGLALIDRPYDLEWMDDPWEDVERAGRWLTMLDRFVKPDIVHLNGYVHATLPWSAPVVVAAHSCVGTWWRAVKAEAPPPCFARYHDAVTAGLAAARAVVAPTAAMLRALLEEYDQRFSERTCVIPNGMAPPSGCAPGAAKQPLIFTAARVWDDAKNVVALGDVAPELPWPIFVAGDARAPGRTEALDLPLRTLGRLPADELADWYARAAIYALPARYEPFGLSVLEAANAGCALVLGDIPSLREVWHGAAAFVPPDHRRGLAATLRALIADPSARFDLSRRAQRRASRLTIARSVAQYLALYERVAA